MDKIELKITPEFMYRDTAQKLFLQLMNDQERLEKEYFHSGMTEKMSMDEYAAHISSERADILTTEIFYKDIDED